MQNFRLNLLLRTVLLIITIFLLAYIVLNTDFIVITFLVGLGIIGLIFEFIHYVDKTNRDLASFLSAIKHDDYSTTFPDESRGKSFGKIYSELNKITDQFQRIRAEKEVQFQYLQTLVEHVEVGLLCFDLSGEVVLMNRALKQLLKKPHISSINGLSKTYPLLAQTFTRLKQGEKELITTYVEDEELELSIRLTEFKLQNKAYKLLSIQNILGELEARDIEAWQKLIRILTHEIMNSVTPIVSLTQTLQEMLQDIEELDEEGTISDAKEGLKAILHRSRGLLHFTEAYRDISRIPEPRFKELTLQQVLEHIQTLFEPKLTENGISFIVRIPGTNFTFQADPELLEQVLINLLQNAEDAVQTVANPVIELQGDRSESGQIFISIRDNGVGISRDVQDKVFVPFFTTKEKGSGIGLSLSRQIMQLHKGSLTLQSAPGMGSQAILKF